ncbi:hypothetical protein EIP86_002481 [Pleurotus ostreatoroseus]|nr:hypothetical protein EIP86_002481 [Pleurotus ostreatoroseus]
MSIARPLASLSCALLKKFHLPKASTSRRTAKQNTVKTAAVNPEAIRSVLLPVDILILILTDLRLRDLIVCRAVSQLFRDVIDSIPSLQYQIELGISQIVPTEQAKKLTLDEKLQYLRDSQPSSLSPRDVCAVQVPSPSPRGSQFSDILCQPYQGQRMDEWSYNAVHFTSVGRGKEKPIVTNWDLTFAEAFYDMKADHFLQDTSATGFAEIRWLYSMKLGRQWKSLSLIANGGSSGA